MAYLPNQQFDEDELEKQRQPSLAGGGGSFGSGVAPAQGMTGTSQKPQQGRSAMQGGGSGFVNLDRFMTGAQMGQQQSMLNNAKSGFQKNETTAFNTASDPLRQAKDQSQRISTANVSGSLGQLGREMQTDSGFQNLKNLVSQQYTGPMQVDYTPGKDSERWRQMGTRETVVDALQPDNKPSSYGLGGRSLDEALFGADAGSRSTIDNAKKSHEEFTGKVADESKQLGDKAQSIKQSYDEKRQQAQEHLKKFYEEQQGRLDRQVEFDNKQENAARQNPDYIAGDLASRENTVTQQQQERFAKLNELIGTNKIENTGPRKAGTLKPKEKPAFEKTKSDQNNYSVSTIKAFEQKMTPEQKQRYEMAKSMSVAVPGVGVGDVLRYSETGDAAYLPPEMQKLLWEKGLI